jgi:hypothetical protein
MFLDNKLEDSAPKVSNHSLTSIRS